MRSVCLLGLLFVLAGCGPILGVIGLNELFSSDSQDLGEPAVQLEILDAEGLVRSAPEFSRTPLVFQPQISKPGVMLSALVVGPIPGDADPADRAAIERDYCDDGTVPVGGSLTVVEVTGLSADAAQNTALNTLLANLPDGVFTLHLRALDGQGRTDCASHTWLYDTLPPTRPRLAAVEALTPRSLRVSWTIAVDLPRAAAAVASGITGYKIYYDVGAATVPDAPRDPNPAFDGTARFGVLEGGSGDSPVFVAGSNVGSFTLTGLFGLRMHYLRVTAIDRAGNETDVTLAEESASRTRAGGDGTFAAPVAVAAGTQPGPLVAGDLDRDGHLDLVVVDHGESNTRVFFGAGDGIVSAPALFPMGGPDVRSAALADLNGDRLLDLFLGSRHTPGTGERGEPFATFAVVAGDEPLEVCAYGDYDNNGTPDVLCVEGTVLLPLDGVRRTDVTPNGILQPPNGGSRLGISDLDSEARCVALLDVDADGDLDTVACLEGKVSVVFGFRGVPTGYPSGGAPHFMTAADFDRDGTLDLAVSNANGTVAVLDGAGDGTFLPPRLIQVGSAPGPIVHADFDADGALDLAIAGSIPGAVTVLKGDGTGSFALRRSFPVNGTPAAMVIGDWNEDLILDLAVSIEEGSVQFLFGNGAMGTADLTYEELLTEPGPVLSLSTGDFNADGVPDLVAARGFDGVAVLLSSSENRQGRGGFLSRANFSVLRPPINSFSPPEPANIDAVVVVDLDSDGILDLVGQGNAGNSEEFVDGQYAPLLRGNGAGGVGDGTFRPDRAGPFSQIGPPVVVPDVGCDPHFTASLHFPVVADFDGDGSRDIMTITEANLRFAIVSTARPIVGECPWDGFVAADVNDDGIVDLVAAMGSFDAVHVLPGVGDGVFLGENEPAPGAGQGFVPGADGFPAGQNPARLVVRDFDHDTIPDVAAINRGTNDISILRGDAIPFQSEFLTFDPRGPGSAAGTFSTRMAYTFASEPTEIAAADLNRDGIPDLVVLQGDARRVSLLVSDSATRTHSVVAGFTVPGTGVLAGVAVADFTSDGILDIALGGDAIRVFAGRGTVSGD